MRVSSCHLRGQKKEGNTGVQGGWVAGGDQRVRPRPGCNCRRLEFIADGLNLWRGAMAMDITLVSPLHIGGTAVRRVVAHGGVALRRKERCCPRHHRNAPDATHSVSEHSIACSKVPLCPHGMGEGEVKGVWNCSGGPRGFCL